MWLLLLLTSYIVQNMILKYWLILINRHFKVSKIIVLHFPLLTVCAAFLGYILRDSFLTESTGNIAHFMLFYFLFQTIFIWTKRIKSGLYFFTKCYVLFPQKRMKLLFYDVFLGVMDINLFLFSIIIPAFLVIVTTWSLYLKIIFIISVFLAEVTFLLMVSIFIRIINTRFSHNKNLFMLGFFSLFFIELITRFTERPDIFYYYPFSGWAGSIVLLSSQGDLLSAFLYILLFMVSILGFLYYLMYSFYPREKDVYL